MRRVINRASEVVEVGIESRWELSHGVCKADVFKKKRLLGSTFPEKIQISENKCRIEKMNRVLLLMLAADKGFMAKKNGQLFKNLKLSGQVEATWDLSNFLEDFGLLCDNIWKIS